MYKENLSSAEDYIFALVADEYLFAKKFPEFASEHEGYAVILEEMDELWDAIKANKTTTLVDRMNEAIQIAAMAIKYVNMAGGETLDKLGRDNE